jgi:hypothetical protein
VKSWLFDKPLSRPRAATVTPQHIVTTRKTATSKKENLLTLKRKQGSLLQSSRTLKG